MEHFSYRRNTVDPAILGLTCVFDGKDFFAICDFVRAYEHFNDPHMRRRTAPSRRPCRTAPAGTVARSRARTARGSRRPSSQRDGRREARRRKERTIRYIASTSYWSHDGRPLTAQEFMDQLFGDIDGLVTSENELRAVWSDAERRTAFIQRLAELGYDADRLEDMQRLIDAPNSDIFDAWLTSASRSPHGHAQRRLTALVQLA